MLENRSGTKRSFSWFVKGCQVTWRTWHKAEARALSFPQQPDSTQGEEEERKRHLSPSLPLYLSPVVVWFESFSKHTAAPLCVTYTLIIDMLTASLTRWMLQWGFFLMLTRLRGDDSVLPERTFFGNYQCCIYFYSWIINAVAAARLSKRFRNFGGLFIYYFFFRFGLKRVECFVVTE